MSDPIYFVVERGPGGHEYPALYYDRLPANAYVYTLRLDRLDSPHWAGKTLSDLWAEYQTRRDNGTLPSSNLTGPNKPQY